MKKTLSLFMAIVVALGIVMCPAANIFAIDAAAAHYVALQTPQDVYNIRNALDGNYVLACDIDLSEYNWEPIGTEEKPFTGSIDSNGYVLKNHKIRAHKYAKDNSMNYELFDYTPIGKTYFDFDRNIVFTEQECSTEISEFMLGCKTNGVEFVGVPSYKNNGNLFGTSSTIFVYKSGALQNPLNLVVRGDVNGDSVCDVIDCASVENAVSKNSSLSGMNFCAADSDGNSEIDVLDYQAIVNKALE